MLDCRRYKCTNTDTQVHILNCCCSFVNHQMPLLMEITRNMHENTHVNAFIFHINYFSTWLSAVIVPLWMTVWACTRAHTQFCLWIWEECVTYTLWGYIKNTHCGNCCCIKPNDQNCLLQQQQKNYSMKEK